MKDLRSWAFPLESERYPENATNASSDPAPQRRNIHDDPRTGEGSFRRFVDHENGLISRAIYSDPEIYKIELEKIFSRAWLFMGHESQIPNPGDFFQTYMGEAKVIVTRAKDIYVQVLLNTCMHRGNSVCKADSGNTKTFMCTYHGWTYNLEGKLVGLPGAKDLYNGTFDKSAWGGRTAD